MSLTNFKNKENKIVTLAFYFYWNKSDKQSILLYSWILPSPKSEISCFTKDIDKKNFLICITDKSEVIISIFEELINGKTLVDILKTFKMKSIHKGLYHWTIPINNYTYRPKCIFLAKEEFGSLTKVFCTPSKNSIAYVESLFCLNKSPYLDNSKFLTKVNNLLIKETGINFLNEVGRLGNIEWFNFMTTNLQDKSMVEVIPIKNSTSVNNISCKKVKVTINSNKNDSFLINMRCINGKAIICDSVKELTINTNTNTVFFDTTEEISLQKLIIWKKVNSSWELWYEKELALFRNIDISMSISGVKGTIQSKNLTNIKKNNQKVIKKIEEFSTFTPVSKFSINSNKNDPWRDVIKSSESFASLLFKQEKGSLFLPKGWEGQKRFYDWMKEIPNKIENPFQIIIIDPYIDSEVLSFIPKFGDTTIEYIIITNTKYANETENKRLNIINNAQIIFNRMPEFNVKIYDVIKEKQLIHDRYILISNSEEKFVKGFNLSNSIQMANKNFPLLITKISDDVLPDIQNWLSDLLKKELKLLWNSKPDKVVFSTPHSEYPTYSKENIIKKLKEKDGWDNISENSYNNKETKKNFDSVFLEKSQYFWDFSVNYLDEWVKDSNIIQRDSIESKQICYILAMDNIYNILNSPYIFNYFSDYCRVSPSVNFALKFLMKSPSNLIKGLKKLEENEMEEQEIKKYSLILHKIYIFLKEKLYYNQESLSNWLDSDIPFIKVFSLYFLQKRIFSNSLKLKNAIKLIDNFDTIKKISILSSWLREYRVIVNINPKNETIVEKDLEQIFNEIAEVWPKESNSEMISKVLINCGGPNKGNWLVSTTNLLILKLIEDKKLKEKAFEVVMEVFFLELFNNKDSFFSEDSIEIIEVYSWTICNYNKLTLIEKITSLYQKEKAVLNKPFIQSISYQDFSISIENLHQILIFIKCILKYENENPKIEDLFNLIKQLLFDFDLLMQTSNGRLNKTVQSLF